VLVFCGTKADATNIAKKVAADILTIGVKPEQKIAEKRAKMLEKIRELNVDMTLYEKLLPFGVFYHHSSIFEASRFIVLL
jgi:replicative superfamily II helicase